MSLFIQNFLSFPVVIFSGLLVIVVFYWLIAVMGLFDINLFDMDSADSVEGSLDVSGLAGLLMKLGLTGVPLTLILSFISAYGWLISYFCVHLGLRFLEPGPIYTVIAFSILFGALIWAVILTNLSIRPLRRIFNQLGETTSANSLIGQVVVIRSSIVDLQRGEAICDNGGAGLLLQVRSPNEQTQFKHGDNVIIVSYQPDTHTYIVHAANEA